MKGPSAVNVVYEGQGTQGMPVYSHVPHNDVLVNDRLYIRQWSHNIVI
jgi:hypothetical protein